jgi:hypothetical protein
MRESGNRIAGITIFLGADRLPLRSPLDELFARRTTHAGKKILQRRFPHGYIDLPQHVLNIVNRRGKPRRYPP